MPKFIHTADWHLGARSVPPTVWVDALVKLKEAAHQYDVDFILCVGDVFDRERPNQRTKDQLLSFLLENKDLFFVFTVGNHDYENKDKTYHSLNYIKMLGDHGALENVTVIEPGKIFEYDEGVIISVETCWEHLFRKTVLEDSFPVNIKAFHGSPPDKSAFFDGNFNEYMTKQHQAMLRESEVSYIALGDIHKNAYPYCGSLFQKTYSCEDGIVYVDTDNDKIVRVSLDIPKKITWDLTKEQSVTEDYLIDGMQSYPNGNFIRVKTALPLPVWSGLDKDKIKNAVKHKEFLEIKFLNASPIDSMERKIPDSVRKAKTVDEEIEGIIDEDSYGLNKKRLKTTCKVYIS